MVKTIKCIITQGVNELREKMNIHEVFDVANKLHTDTNYFLLLKPTEKGTEISDGNGSVLQVLSSKIPEKLYCIRDDYGSEYVTTLLLPEEY
jgi:hypothetical protein